LREIAKIHSGEFILTGNQNLVISNISNKEEVEKILADYKIDNNSNKSAMRLHSIACVALNLCPLAHAEAERYLPSLIDKIDVILEANNLTNDAITIRMTGCPNGCGRPYLAEIGFVGKAPGKYNMYLGAAHNGSRLNKLYKEMLSEEDILNELKVIIPQYASEREKDEKFGDFVIRKGIITAMEDHKQFQLVPIN
jgi:sulfite reductase (NADPH) hemoprotein beta-component